MSALIRRAGTETVGCGHTEMSDARALLYNIRLGTPTVLRSNRYLPVLLGRER